MDHLEQRGREKAGAGKRTSFQGWLDCVIMLMILMMIVMIIYFVQARLD